MTDTLKSVLFVDYDSLHLALRARDPALGRRFAARPGLLLEAIEAGTLVSSDQLGKARRRILMRRCYADPRTLGKARDSFVAQGFQIVDCPTLPGRERNSAEVQITLDTIDALGHSTAFDEFILLGAETDFTPLVYRLRAHNRAATIFATTATAGGYRAIADGILEERALVALLGTVEDSGEDEDDEAAKPVAEREDLAGLARRIHNAAAVPLFAPKVYAELFAALTAEIAENGYHFQNTAENVAGRLIAAGRKASRRQVAFVVKGLALKGHVLSESDTPEKLAAVFREQVLYLARHAGIAIDPRVERQVNAWIAGGTSPGDGAEPGVPAELASPAPESAVEAVEAPAGEAGLGLADEALAGPLDADEPAAAADEPAPVIEEPVPDATEPALASEEPAPAVEVVAADLTSAPDAVVEVAPQVVVSKDDLVALADQADGEEEDGDEALAEAVPAEPVRAAPAVRPPVPRLPGQRNGTRPAEVPLDPFESSLLAAIAEAVQAVDPARVDGAPPVVAHPAVAPPVAAPVAGADGRIEPRLDASPRSRDPVKDAAADDVVVPADPRSPEEAAVDADIGDEIQRILSAYNQNRKPGGR